MTEAETASKPTTVSIFQVLATLPSGRPSALLTSDEFALYLRTHVGQDGDNKRNVRHALRDEFYRDGGVQFMTSFINEVFVDATVRDLRKKWVKYARFNNAIKRIINELSTVYSEPARRMVGASVPFKVDPGTDVSPVETDNDRYQKVLEAVRIDERMIEIGRLLNLHRALLVGFRVRAKPDGTREPVLDIATPANIRAIMHPNDDTLVVGWLIKTAFKTARAQTETPAWTCWTDHESMHLRADFTPIPGTYQEHELGTCPWVPVTLGPPTCGFWPGDEGEDLVAAHVAIWFQNILLLKESKSATKQTILGGDGTAMARGQAADSEVPIETADGQSVSTVDMSMDLSLFRDTPDHILNNVGHNYGMSPAILQHQGVQSAQARDLMLIPLKERRRQQQTPLRRFEHQLAIVMSLVLKVDMPELEFSPDGWRMEFGESETPLAPLDEQTLFERRRTAGVDNTIAFLQRRHPGLTEEDAFKMLQANNLIETERVRLMRELMAMSGALGQPVPADVHAADRASGTPDAQSPPPPPQTVMPRQ